MTSDNLNATSLITQLRGILRPDSASGTVTTPTSYPDERFNNCNPELATLKEDISLVWAQLDAFSTMRDEVSQAVRQGRQALDRIQKRLALYPPAMPPGAVLPVEMLPQECRPTWQAQINKPLNDEIDVVLAHYYPQAKKDEVWLNQIIPVELLDGLQQYTGINNSLLFIVRYGRRNTRASLQASAGVADIFGDVFIVPSPLSKERWLPLVIEKPRLTVIETKEEQKGQSISRYTIDKLANGSQLLSFADKNDQLMAKMTLSG